MEKLVSVKPDYASLDKLYEFLKKESSFECSQEYDIWEHRVDTNGQLSKCIIIKRSSMHAVKLYFANENTVKVSYVIPNKIMHAYFGKSVKARRNILEIIVEKIKDLLLASSQQNAFNELERVVQKAA